MTDPVQAAQDWAVAQERRRAHARKRQAERLLALAQRRLDQAQADLDRLAIVPTPVEP